MYFYNSSINGAMGRNRPYRCVSEGRNAGDTDGSRAVHVPTHVSGVPMGAGLDYAGWRAYNLREMAARGWVLESADNTGDGELGGVSGDVPGEASGRAPGRNPQGVENRPTILGVMSAGHGVAHLYDQGVPVMLPEITSYFGLSTFQVTIIHALRFVGFGVVNIGGGLVVDMWKRHWGRMLTWCMWCAAAFFAALGASPTWVALMLIVPLVSIPGALWHLPSAASLSQVFADKRGFAISIHGFGANIGNLVGPIVAAWLLRSLRDWRGSLFGFAIPAWALAAIGSWRGVMWIYIIPALVMGVFVWVYLRNVGQIGSVEQRDVRGQIRASLRIARNRTALLLVGAAMLRGVGLDAVFAWSPFYLSDTLGKDGLDYGVHFALLTGMGIVSAPVLGYLSDRFSRKAVLIPGFLLAAGLSFVTVAAGGGWALSFALERVGLSFVMVVPGGGWALSLVLAGTGLFSFALHQIVQASVLDVVGEGTEATAVGLIFGLNGILGALSPFLGYYVIENFGGYGAVYFYAGVLTLIACALIVIAPATDAGGLTQRRKGTKTQRE